jgi:hypothetical protein
MRALRHLLTFSALLFGIFANAQLLVYNTYDDLVNKTPMSYENAVYKKAKGTENAVIVFDRGGKDDLELECAKIWGFKYKDVTFRISKDSKYFVKKAIAQVGIPCVIMQLCDVVFYEDGLSYLEAMQNKKGRAIIKENCMCGSISKDLNSDMAAIPCNATNWTDEQILLLVHEYPDLSELAAYLDALKANQRALMAGMFTSGQMSSYVREFAENKKKK